jgi:polar amino acid transport system substrate-binding protein
MNFNAGRGAGGAKLFALITTILMVCTLGSAPPAAADADQCVATGLDGAIALPRKLATANRPHEDKYTTSDVEPLG